MEILTAEELCQLAGCSLMLDQCLLYRCFAYKYCENTAQAHLLKDREHEKRAIVDAIESAKNDKCKYGINPCLSCESDGWEDTQCRIDCPDWTDSVIDKGVITPIVKQAVTDAVNKVIEDVEEYQQVHHIKDDDCFSDGDYVIIPVAQWQQRKQQYGGK
jgi:hypothetical protein